MEKPLAVRLRPKCLDDIVGQKHLVSDNGVIRKLVNKKKIFSCIFYGPPGIGKTSLANAMVNELNLRYRELNAVINNKKDFDIVLEEAKMYQGLVVIMDEIHRLNKDKQDLLLPHIESGLITLIGITSANPFHKINPAIRSRCQLFELKPFSSSDILEGIDKIIESNVLNVKITDEAKQAIVRLSNYDYRSAINTLEMAAYVSDGEIDFGVIEDLNNKPIYLSDANEDNFYDMLSAFQKSIRGSDVDASLYYLARLIETDDFESIFRRMTVIVYEDIGLASPGLQNRVNLGISACERVGMPEARIVLANLVIEMALAPKSNSAYLAIDMALNDIRSGKSYPIPSHIKNHSKNYKYPHDFEFSYVKQRYLPEKLNSKYYVPKKNKNEKYYDEIIKNLEKIK